MMTAHMKFWLLGLAGGALAGYGLLAERLHPTEADIPTTMLVRATSQHDFRPVEIFASAAACYKKGLVVIRNQPTATVICERRYGTKVAAVMISAHDLTL